MTLDDLIQMAIEGRFDGRCECHKDECGYCDCIKTVFPSETHYEFYLLLRERYQLLLKLGIFGVLLQQTEEMVEGEKYETDEKREIH